MGVTRQVEFQRERCGPVSKLCFAQHTQAWRLASPKAGGLRFRGVGIRFGAHVKARFALSLQVRSLEGRARHLIERNELWPSVFPAINRNIVRIESRGDPALFADVEEAEIAGLMPSQPMPDDIDAESILAEN